MRKWITRLLVVVFAFGQSNSANAGRDRYAAGPGVSNYNFHDEKCYHAVDPLLGADGIGGSVWGMLADKMIASGEYDRVLIVPIGIGGTEIARWAPDGDLHVRVREAARQLAEKGIRPTHVLWHQGESDNDPENGIMSTTPFYVEKFTELAASLREYGIDAPIFPAVTSRCYDNGPNKDVRGAQKQLPNLVAGVYPGPDTDAITGSAMRYDDCHFTAVGMHEHSDRWLAAIAAR